MHVIIEQTEFNQPSTINLELINVDPRLLKQQLDMIISLVAGEENEQDILALTDCIYDSLYKYLDQ